MLLPVVPAVVLALAVSTAGFSEETPVEERVGRTSFRRPTVALVLEGGGALGLAHVGVIKVLEEVGIPVDIVTGTSMGSIVGGLYALGYDAASLERVAAETDWLKLFSEYDTAWNESYRVREDRGAFFLSVGVDGRGITGLGGLLSGNRVLTYLDCLVAAAPGPVPSRDFDDLPRRYRAVATDAETGDEVVLSGGSPADAMRASMGIPGVFAPYPLGGRLLVDGGLVNNLPVDLARSLGADIIIAVDLPGGFFTQGKSVEQNALDSLSRTVEIMIRSHVLPQLEKADFLITVDLREFTAADFAKGPAIRAQGEAAARRALPRLQALRDSLFAGGRPETSGAEQPAAEGPAIDTVVIVGGTQADRNAARKLLTSLEGTSPDFCVLADRVSRVYAERPIQGLRIRRNADRPGELTAELQSRKSEGHVLRLGLSYGGTYSKSSSSRVTVTPGVALRNVFGDESELAVNVEALGALGMEAAVRKEFRGFLFSEASFSARRDFDTYYFSGGEESSVEFVLYESSAKLGFRVGAYPLPGTRLSLGFDRDWISDTASPIYLPDLSGSDVSVLSAAFSVMKTDSPVLPMEGISLDILLRQGIPILGASRFFRTLDGAGEAHLSLDTPFSLGILWRAGMDFSGAVDASDSAPLLYKPDLADRRLFPNPLSAEERIGNLVAAGGVEVKSRLDRLSQAVRVPAVVLFHGAVGVSYQDFYLSDQTDPALHWNAAAGAGLRINDGFALLLRGGAAGGYGREIFPYFAVDLGAIGRTR